jgi:hypothetical protein
VKAAAKTRVEPILELADIQGNVIPGFKKDHQHFLFFRIADVERARSWIASLAPTVSSADEVLKANMLWKEARARLGSEPDHMHFVFRSVGISTNTTTAQRRCIPAQLCSAHADPGIESRSKYKTPTTGKANAKSLRRPLSNSARPPYGST